MTNVIIEVSKYVLIFLMAVYTYLNFSYFRFHDVWEQNRTCARQNVMMFFIHLIAYAILFLKSEDERVVLFYLAQLVFFTAYIGLYRLFYRNMSRILVNNMCMLLCVGFIMLTRLSFDKAIRQFLIVAVSALITWIIPFIMDRVWQRFRGFTVLSGLDSSWVSGSSEITALEHSSPSRSVESRFSHRSL